MTTKKSEPMINNYFPALSKYDMNTIKIEDVGLARYINLNMKNIYLGGINANKIFSKSKIPVFG